MEIIKSKENLSIKEFSFLINNSKKRLENKQFIAEGARFCMEAAQSGCVISEVLVTLSFKENRNDVFEVVSKSCSNIKFISDEIAKKISDTVNPQGIFCKCQMPIFDFSKIKAGKFIALENLRDPGNMGTVIRTAQAFNIDGILIFGDCVDVYSPKVLRSTMGTIFKMPIYNLKSNYEYIETLKNSGFTIYGAVLDNKATSLTKTKFENDSVCFIGNEANGLSDTVKKICDKYVYIDMPGDAESLNAAVASSILMWEMIK